MLKKLTIHYLEITNSDDFRPVNQAPAGVRMVHLREASAIVNQTFYLKIDRDWDWTDRRDWTYDQWQEYVNNPDLETWIVHVDGEPAGYLELIGETNQSVNIAYLGLLPEHTGKGIGAYLVSFAIQRGFDKGARRVWVSTCTLDHPAALRSYQHRGFKIFKSENIEKEFPDI